jgi:hypothetical protein
MPNELFLLIALLVAPIAATFVWGLWLVPNTSGRPRKDALPSLPSAQPGTADRLPTSCRRDRLGVLRIAPEAAFAARRIRPPPVRAIPLGIAAGHARGGVRVLILLEPARTSRRDLWRPP